MLSQKNIEQLCFSGIYKAVPNKDLLHYYDGLEYWTHNWIFRVGQSYDGPYMLDTKYNHYVMLTDTNFRLFQFMFDINGVKESTAEEAVLFDESDRWFVAMNSGGWKRAKWYVRADAKPSIDYQINDIRNKIKDAESKIRHETSELTDLKRQLAELMKDKQVI